MGSSWEARPASTKGRTAGIHPRSHSLLRRWERFALRPCFLPRHVSAGLGLGSVIWTRMTSFSVYLFLEFFFLLVSVVQTSNWCGVFRNCEEGMKSRADLALGRNHCSLTHSRPDTLPRGFLFCGFDSDWECGKLMRLCIITRGTLSTGYFIGNNRPVTSPFPTPSFPTRFCSCIACCRLYENDFFWWW